MFIVVLPETCRHEKKSNCGAGTTSLIGNVHVLPDFRSKWLQFRRTESSVLGIRKKTSRCQEEAARLQEEEKATISDGVVESSTSEMVNLPSDHVDNVQSVQNGS